MNNDQHYSMELHKQIIKKFDEIEALIKGLEAHYNLDNLENLQKEIQKLPPDLKQIGLEKLNPLCSQISTDISVKIKNFYFNEPKEQWFNELNLFLNKIKQAQDNAYRELNMQTSNIPKKSVKRRVVIVDDDEDLLKLLTHEFQQLGFISETFKTGSDALTFIMNKENLNDVFLLILDRMLPDMDGLDILTQFEEKSTTKVPVLILSVLASEQDITAGLRGGALDYITKPFSVFMLMQKALNLLKMQK